jgi:hypothetical protein
MRGSQFLSRLPGGRRDSAWVEPARFDAVLGDFTPKEAEGAECENEEWARRGGSAIYSLAQRGQPQLTDLSLDWRNRRNGDEVALQGEGGAFCGCESHPAAAAVLGFIILLPRITSRSLNVRGNQLATAPLEK